MDELLIANQYKVINTYRGGMGNVHLCLDTKDNDFPVALKTFLPEFLPDTKMRERFLREATIWIELGYHPNIVQAYKVFHIADDHTVYIVMQLIPAYDSFGDPSLQRQLNEGTKFSEENRLNIIHGIVMGMKYASSKLPFFVHKDIKPANILIGLDGQPKITDFGIASVRNNYLTGNDIRYYKSNHTSTIGMGTPFYMAPEQWTNEHIDQRADIYSIGCLLFEMLTNEYAVNGDSVENIYHAHMSGMALKNLEKANFKESIKNLLRNCLDPYYQNRYNSWNEVDINIRELIVNEGYELKNTELAPDDVSLQAQFQKAGSYLAIGGAHISIGNYDQSISFFKKAEEISIKQDFPIIYGLSIADQGVALANQGYYKEAIAYYKKSIEAFNYIGDVYQECIHTANIGNAYFVMHEIDNAADYFERSYKLAETIPSYVMMSNCKAGLGWIFCEYGDFSKGQNCFQSALDLIGKTKNLVSVPKLLIGLASSYEGLENFNKALETLDFAKIKAKEIGDPQVFGLLNYSYGLIYLKLGLYDKCIASCNDALIISREINDNLLTARTCGNLAIAYIYVGKFIQAIPLLEETIKISNEIRVYDMSARAHWSLGVIYENQGEYIKAVSNYRDAVSRYKMLNMREYTAASTYLKELRKQLGLL